ncbi:MAG: LemA family protein [Chthoniobacterales bacterium]
MNYDPKTHPAFSDYLEAVEQSLLSAGAPSSNRQEIRENLIAQFENALSDSERLNEDEYVRSLDDPKTFAKDWEVEETGFSEEPPKTGFPRSKVIAITGAIVAGVVLLLAISLATYLIRLRNEIVVARTFIKASWAQVETVLQRRYDLIPNLVDTTKGFAKQERTVLEEVVRLRSQWGQAKTPEEQRETASQLEGSLMKVVALSEQYPNLASNEQFMNLQFQLEGTENRIAVARNRYNDALRSYNALVQQFPAMIFGYGLDEDFFESDAGAKSAPKTGF